MSKQGLLGVEGMGTECLKEIFKKAGIYESNTRIYKACYTKTDLYNLGLSGHEDSGIKREQICKENDLPTTLSANAFLEAVNILGISLEASD